MKYPKNQHESFSQSLIGNPALDYRSPFSEPRSSRFQSVAIRILKTNNFERVEGGRFVNLNDRFNDYQYLKIGDNDEFYQRSSRRGGYGFDTIRINAQHTNGILRSESDSQVRQQQLHFSNGS